MGCVPVKSSESEKPAPTERNFILVSRVSNLLDKFHFCTHLHNQPHFISFFSPNTQLR